MYKEKGCKICNDLFVPVSGNQKRCNACIEVANKRRNKVYERKRSRIRNGYKKYIRNCKACGIGFETYYGKKTYCGADKCNLVRKRNNSANVEKKRNAIRKLIRRKNRIINKCNKIKEIKNYVEGFGYKLISANHFKNCHAGDLYLRCPEGHKYFVTYHGFKDNNNRCLKCYLTNNYTSEIEDKVFNYFKNNYPDIDIIRNDRNTIFPKELDIYFPSFNVAVEICGLYWHSECLSGKSKEYHYSKMNACFNKGVRLITVFEDEVNNKFDVVISRIKQAIGLTENRIFARKCEVKQIVNVVANNFFNDNHIQGKSTSIISWGLFYKNELVSALSLGNPVRKHTSFDSMLELKRFCTSNGVVVVGGVSKLFKKAKEYCINNNIGYIKSYCDMRYANIFFPVYELLGFKLVGFTKYTPHYFKNGKRYRNFSLRKTKEEQKLNKTEFELRIGQGYDRIWDTGHRTYLYKI